MPRGYRQPDDIGERTGVAVRHSPAEAHRFRTEDDFVGHHPLEPTQPTDVLAGVAALQQVAAHPLTREPYPHSSARHGQLVEVGRHEVVEGSIQVRQRDVDGHGGHRSVPGHSLVVPVTTVHRGRCFPW